MFVYMSFVDRVRLYTAQRQQHFSRNLVTKALQLTIIENLVCSEVIIVQLIHSSQI